MISFSLDTAVNNGGAGAPSVVPGILWGQIQVTHFSSSPFPNLYQSGYLFFSGDRAASFGAMMQDKNGTLFMVASLANVSGAKGRGVGCRVRLRNGTRRRDRCYTAG